MYICIYIYTYVSICVYALVYICIHIYIESYRNHTLFVLHIHDAYTNEEEVQEPKLTHKLGTLHSGALPSARSNAQNPLAGTRGFKDHCLLPPPNVRL